MMCGEILFRLSAKQFTASSAKESFIATTTIPTIPPSIQYTVLKSAPS